MDRVGNSARRGGFVKLLIPLGIVCALVVVELVAAALLIPTAGETDSLANEYVAAQRGETTTNTGAEAESYKSDDEHSLEIDLGNFDVSRYDPKTDKTIDIEIELCAVVPAEQAADFTERLSATSNRVREQVIMILHGADPTEFGDPGLGLIKRQVLEKVNRALSRPLVREVVVTGFNFVER